MTSRSRSDGTEIALHPSAAGSLALPPGAGGLSTLRVECSLHAEVTIRPGTAIAFRDDADPGRIGWHEVTAAGDGMTLARSDVPATSSSGRLTAYPADLLSSPLDQRSASIVAGTAGGQRTPRPRPISRPPRSLEGSATGSRRRSRPSSRPVVRRRCCGSSPSRPRSRSAGCMRSARGTARR